MSACPRCGEPRLRQHCDACDWLVCGACKTQLDLGRRRGVDRDGRRYRVANKPQ